MRPAHVLALFAALVGTMLLIGPCRTMSQSEHSLSVDGGDRSSEAKLNAFALGFFSGLTIGVSDIAFGSLMTLNEVERARADRIAHDDLDTLGKILGFGVLLFGGWRLFRRLRHKDE